MEAAPFKYVGIDLGTTNSAICAFNGESVRLFKSPEQNDVTPSVIFIDRRGKKYVGALAYNNAARNPDSAAALFKRLMGTSTPVELPAVHMTLTPEECSAHVLSALFGYLPEEIRSNPDLGTVITVPAAFNQMQKDSTLVAAQSAGIGRVALMQEPVAAVMSVMRQRKNDGIFVVYDLGGGTLDVAIAESISGRVTLLAHGGIAMCGGRDFDRILMDSIIKPWLLTNFDLPENFTVDPAYKSLLRMATWAAERSKIELSHSDSVIISMPETELGVRDRKGQDIYLDIDVERKRYDDLINTKVQESIQAVRDTLRKAGVSTHDAECIVFVGGPTHYKPLRDKVAFELGIAPSTDINPMTAVAEGAAIFAESIDWSSQNRGRKSARGTLSADTTLDLSFNYLARTPEVQTKVAIKLGASNAAELEYQIDSLDSGWSSGRMQLKDASVVSLNLAKPGENTFKVFVFDNEGAPVTLSENKIIITRTAASVDAIPASHSIGVEALDKAGGRPVLEYLVHEGDQLPKKGSKTFRAHETLRAGSVGSLKFKLWEGDIATPITDNRFIGLFEIKGSDFASGVIVAGAELICEYKMLDSGNIVLDVSIPSISGSFDSGHNFYSSQNGKVNYAQQAKHIESERQTTWDRLNAMAETVSDTSLDQAREKLSQVDNATPNLSDPETAKQAMDFIQDAKRLLGLTRKTHLKEIRQMELDKSIRVFEQDVRTYANASEINACQNLIKTAQRAIDTNATDFEPYLETLRERNFAILWRQDWFVIDCFSWLTGNPHFFPDEQAYKQIFAAGQAALEKNDMQGVRTMTNRLYQIRQVFGADADLMASANIVRN
jgi:molecular chaperone DnaK